MKQRKNIYCIYIYNQEINSVCNLKYKTSHVIICGLIDWPSYISSNILMVKYYNCNLKYDLWRNIDLAYGEIDELDSG